MLDDLLAFFISLLIGLMIGLEREHTHVEKIQPIGVRTFILFALIGTLTAIVNQIYFTFILCIFTFTIILLSYFRASALFKNKSVPHITTEITAAMVFCLGYLVPSHPLLAIIISSMVLLVLVERQRLHTLAKQRFKPHEIESAIILIIFALGILPILPNKTIDSWHLFNPRNFGILIGTIASIQFGGYVMIRLMGERFGIALVGFLGGLISSTIIVANLQNTFNEHPKFTIAIMASVILATVATLLETITIVGVASPTLLTALIAPLAAMVTAGSIIAGILLNFQKRTKQHSKLSNPLNIFFVLRTSIFIGFILILIAIVKRYAGTEGIILISFLGGLFEIHAITLATTLLFLNNQLNSFDSGIIIYLAVFASFITKFVLLCFVSYRRFALMTSLCLLIMLASGMVTYWISYHSHIAIIR